MRFWQSYVLSRTLVPTMVMWFERHRHGQHKVAGSPGSAADTISRWLRPLVRFQQGFEHAFENFRHRYQSLLSQCLAHRFAFAAAFLAFCAASLCLVPFLGQDFFPNVDAGMFRLHVRAFTGTRLEESAALVDRVEASIRTHIPARELDSIIDNIGLPVSGINLSYNDSGIAGTADTDITVSLKPGHKPTADYVRNLRLALNREFPGVIDSSNFTTGGPLAGYFAHAEHGPGQHHR